MHVLHALVSEPSLDDAAVHDVQQLLYKCISPGCARPLSMPYAVQQLQHVVHCTAPPACSTAGFGAAKHAVPAGLKPSQAATCLLEGHTPAPQAPPFKI